MISFLSNITNSLNSYVNYTSQKTTQLQYIKMLLCKLPMRKIVSDKIANLIQLQQFLARLSLTTPQLAV